MAWEQRYVILSSGSGARGKPVRLTTEPRNGLATTRQLFSGSQFDGLAELPRFIPTWDSASFLAYNGGDIHSPINDSELNTLLTGGSLSGKTLKRGDIIRLTAGTIYNTTTNTHTFPSLSGAFLPTDPSTWVHVRSSDSASLPVAGRRVSDSHTGSMPIFQTRAGGAAPCISIAAGAAGYVFSGIRARGGGSTNSSRIVQLGNITYTNLSGESQYLIMERCYVSATASNGCRRTIYAQGRQIIIRDSYIYNDPGHWTGSVGSTDDQGIMFVEGQGALIENNYAVGGSQCIFAGGTDLNIPDNNPRDITIKRNYLHKPLTWAPGDPTYDGIFRGIKTSYELKGGVRVLFEHNIVENCWSPVGPDSGQHALNFKTVNQAGLASNKSVHTDDVVLRFNKLINTWNFFKFTDIAGSPGKLCTNATVRNNLVQGVANGSLLTGSGVYNSTWYAMGTNIDNLTMDRNTIISSQSFNGTTPAGANGGNILVPNHVTPEASRTWTPPYKRTSITNNIFPALQYGVKTGGSTAGNSTISTYFGSTSSFAGNIVIGIAATSYPNGNSYVSTVAGVGFVDTGSNNWRISGSSAYKNAATDGGAPGADIDLLETYTAGCITGVWS